MDGVVVIKASGEQPALYIFRGPAKEAPRDRSRSLVYTADLCT